MKVGSLFAGCEGMGSGLESAGMEIVYQCENEPACVRVLERHYPTVYRDMDVNDADPATLVRLGVQLLAFGFPCQDISVAGQRAGLAGKRSGLFWQCIRILEGMRDAGAPAEFFLCENVAGLLSSWTGDTPSSLGIDPGRGRTMDMDETSDMSTVVAAFANIGYGVAWATFDSQWFGVPQRRRRVFFVGCLGDGRRAGEILFEREGMPWDSPPRRQTGTRIAASLTQGSGVGSNAPGRRREDDVNLAVTHTHTQELSLALTQGGRFDGESETFVCGSLNAHQKQHGHAMTTQQAAESGQLVAACLNSGGNNGGFRTEPGEHLVAHTLRSEGHDASEDGTGRGVPLIAFAQNQRNEVRDLKDLAGSVAAQPGMKQQTYVAGFKRGQGAKARSDGYQVEQSPTLTSSDSGTQQSPGVQIGLAVRRLMPIECERLQGLPDDWTRWDAQGNELSDSARYRMLGNAVTKNVAEWIGRRILEHSRQTRT